MRHCRRLSSLLIVLALFSFLADEAHARRGSRRGGSSSTSGSSALEIAPYADNSSSGYRTLSVYYNYNRANAQNVAFSEKLRVFLAVSDARVLGERGRLVAEVKIADLSNDASPRVRYYPVKLEDTPDGKFTYGYFDITNDGEKEAFVLPAHVYRMFVNLHRKADTQGRDTALGHIEYPYYVATAGDTRVDRARQQIVMRTFREFYYRKQGWPSGEKYAMDCHDYYMWATGFCTVGARDEKTQLDRLFGDGVPYNNGGQIPDLGTRGPIHGDYVRKPGHSFMLLAYDPHQRHVWTMEGNFNSTVEVAIRPVSSDWTVGHLRDEHIRRGLFPRVRGLIWGRADGR